MATLKELMQTYAAKASSSSSITGSRGGDENGAAARKRPRHDEESTAAPLPPPASTPPHFLIVGAQKAGTMAAVKNLNKHPSVSCLSEVHFFDLGWHSKTVHSYRDLFRGPQPCRGEKTPELIYVDECLLRMKQVLAPGTKFLFFVRDPVKRAYSAWNMNRSKDREDKPFDTCVEANLAHLDEYRSYGTAEYHLVQRGFYMDQIERFLQVFPDRANLLVVVAEHIQRDPEAQYRRIFDFLGVGPAPPGTAWEDDHVGQYGGAAAGGMGKAVEARLRKVFRPHNERLYRWLGVPSIPEWEGGDSSSSGGAASTGSKEAQEPPAPVPAQVVSREVTAAAPAEPAAAQLTTAGDASWAVRRVTVAGATEFAFPPTALAAGPFAAAGLRSGTDKVSHHGYQRFYPRFLEPYRALAPGCALLEIGIDRQCSLQLWLEYFPHAFVYGIDRGADTAVQGERHRVFQCDQSDRRQLEAVAAAIDRPVFAVIDDGSHVPQHQVATFDYLFSRLLAPGGTYIIEDIETSYWTRNGLYGYPTRYGYHHEQSCVEVFKDLLDDVNAEFLSPEARRAQERRVGRDLSPATRAAVGTVTFGQNCIVVTKKTSEEAREYNDRRYRYENNL